MRYVAERILFSILSLCVLLFITFLLSHVVAGDPAIVAAGPNAGADKIAAVRLDMGLDQPMLVQFWRYSAAVFQGDLDRKSTRLNSSHT